MSGAPECFPAPDRPGYFVRASWKVGKRTRGQGCRRLAVNRSGSSRWTSENRLTVDTSEHLVTCTLPPARLATLPAQANQTNQIGAFGGVGFRIVNKLRMKFTPEVRFVHWQGIAFQGISYRSARNQVEVSLGWSY